MKELVLQRTLHPDPFHDKEANLTYMQGQFKGRMREECFSSSPIIGVAMQVADHYQEILLSVPRWVTFGLGDQGTDMNVAAHHYRQTVIADVTASLDGVPRREREVTNAGSTVHDIGEYVVTDVPKPEKMKDPRKWELLEAKVALQMIKDSPIDSQEAEALMEIYWRLMTSMVTEDEYHEFSGVPVGAWQNDIDWERARESFERSEFHGYSLTAAQQFEQMSHPLTPEELYRAVHWNEQHLKDFEEGTFRVKDYLLLSESMRRTFLFKSGIAMDHFTQSHRQGNPSSLFFGEQIHNLLDHVQRKNNLGAALTDIAPSLRSLQNHG